MKLRVAYSTFCWLLWLALGAPGAMAAVFTEDFDSPTLQQNEQQFGRNATIGTEGWHIRGAVTLHNALSGRLVFGGTGQSLLLESSDLNYQGTIYRDVTVGANKSYKLEFALGSQGSGAALVELLVRFGATGEFQKYEVGAGSSTPTWANTFAYTFTVPAGFSQVHLEFGDVGEVSNAPAAIDHIVLTEIPEPDTASLASVLGIAGLACQQLWSRIRSRLFGGPKGQPAVVGH